MAARVQPHRSAASKARVQPSPLESAIRRFMRHLRLHGTVPLATWTAAEREALQGLYQAALAANRRAPMKKPYPHRLNYQGKMFEYSATTFGRLKVWLAGGNHRGEAPLWMGAAGATWNE